MKTLVAALPLLFASCLAPESHCPPDDTPQAKLACLSFLTGDWVGKSPKGRWEAHYTTPEGGLLLGTSKEYIDGRVTAFEFEMFQIEGDDVVVWPHPNGKKKVPFKLTLLDRGKRKAVFENPQHDFPQRLEYWRHSDDRLVISVTSPGKGGKEDKPVGFRLVLSAY